MTDPKYAQSIPGKGRWYVHPGTGEMWPSVTNVLDTAVNKQALVPWAAKATAEGAWQHLPAMVASSRRPVCSAKRVSDRCGTCSACVTAAIKGHHKIIKDQAADLGSRVHAYAESHVLQTAVPDDPEVEPYAMQLLAFFHEWGVDIETDIEAAEVTVINRQHGYAGTGDLLAHMRIDGKRRLCLIDYKTSSTRDVTSVYPEHGMQCAALAHGEVVLLDNGQEVEMPTPELAFILNLRADSHALIPMPVHGSLDDAFTGFLGCLRAADYLHECYGAKPQPILPKITTRKARNAA